jgi:Fic family protein
MNDNNVREMHMDFIKIDELSCKLKSMRPLNATEMKRLQDEFMVENTYNSNAIEGNSLTLRETALILQEGITIAEKPIKEHLEVIGHKDAFEYVVSLAGANDPLTERVIKEIHSLVLMNDSTNRGLYRRVPVIISGAAHTPPQPYLVPIQMETLVADYENMKLEKHIIESVAEFHLRFEGIHPFIDGNGRTGRLILNLELIKAGLLPVNIKFSDRRKYYDCFDHYYTNGHASDTLASLIADYEKEELLKHIAIIEDTLI